jgi:ssDNA-binding replication factor A large subunit
MDQSRSNHSQHQQHPRPARQLCSTLRHDAPVHRVEVVILRVYPIRRIASERFTGPVAAACGRDESGIIGMVLWGDQTERIKVGDIIRLTNGWCRRRDGELVISTGMDGSMMVLDR